MVSDVVMPTMDGPTTAREARKTHPDLPILFISGYAEEQLRQSIDLERVAFLAKPFSVQKLAEATRDALAMRGHPPLHLQGTGDHASRARGGRPRSTATR